MLLRNTGKHFATACNAGKLLLRSGLPDYILYFSGGIGDDLLLSTVAHEFVRQRGAKVWILSDQPSLFLHNPSVAGALKKDYGMIKLLTGRSDRLLCLNTTTYVEQEARDIPPVSHLAVSMCEKAGLGAPEAVRPYIYLTSDEQQLPKPTAPYVVIHTSGASAANAMPTKEWFPDRFAVVADHLLSRFNIVQLGSSSDPALPGALDLRGRTSLRESARILSGAVFCVGLVGFLMHLARAVDCPSVIIYGGREHPAQSGYAENQNLYQPVPCAPCWRHHCEIGRVCMQEISVNMVIEAVERLLSTGKKTDCAGARSNG